MSPSGLKSVAGWMHRKAEEEEAASSASGDDENAVRRRPGAEIYGEFLARDTRWRRYTS
jgi:hypothetical protein